jgi:hypothetical protein
MVCPPNYRVERVPSFSPYTVGIDSHNVKLTPRLTHLEPNAT